MKILKPSKRGVTFSLKENTKNFSIGSKCKYVVDIKKKQIVIEPYEKESGRKLTISRKKSGDAYRPLIDIRSAEAKQLLANAEKMEVEVQEEQIIVTVIQKTSIFELIRGRKKSRRKETKRIAVPMTMLRKAVGAEEYAQYTLDQYFQTLNLDASDSAANSFINKTSSDIKRVFQMISLFSGSGMFDFSFHKDDSFNIVAAVDYSEAAVETYRANIGDYIMHGDIADFSGAKYRDLGIDLVCGSPSCRPWASTNRTKRLESHFDYTLTDHYCRIVKECDSKVFVIENVPDYLSSKDGEILKHIMDELGEYEITAKVLKDSDYGGYTGRKRAFVIGSKIGKISFPEMIDSTKKTVREALEKVDASWYNYNDVTIPREETRKKMHCVPQGGNYQSIPSMQHLDRHSNVYRRLSLSETSCPSIVNWRKVNLLHPLYDRILSVSEAAALSGLDKGFKFIGKLSEMQQMVGNGVPQSFSKLIKNITKRALNKYYDSLESAQLCY